MKNSTDRFKPLKGKTVVITGGSSGVGRATAEAFALEGCNVVVAARGKEALDEVVQLCHDLGVPAAAVQADVSVSDDVKNLAERAKQFNGRIDIWVNNAGVMASGKFEEIPMEIHEQTVGTNLFGYIHGAYHVLPIFKTQKDGILINNVSIGGFMPAPYSAVYSATKAGIKAMMDGLQGEISNEPGIHICNIYPQVQRSTGNMHSAKFSGLDFKIPPFAADPRDTAKKIVELAKSPQKDKFPDFMSYFIKTAYGIMPKTIVNSASAGMRVLMKVKKAAPDSGNILKPSGAPHRIYGETMLPVPSKKTKTAAAMIMAFATAYYFTSKKKK